MHALFVCTLTEHPARPGMYGPKVLRELRGNIPRNAYVLIPWDEANPVAVGIAELTGEQAAAFDLLPGVWVFDSADWRNKTVSQIPAAVRTRLTALLTGRGISANVRNQDTVAQAIAKIITAIGEDPLHLLAAYKGATGVDL